MTDKEFEDAINGVGQFAPKPKFRGTGGGIANPGKQSKELVWINDKEAIIPGQFGEALGKWAKNESKADFNKSKEQILEEIRKEQLSNEK